MKGFLIAVSVALWLLVLWSLMALFVAGCRSRPATATIYFGADDAYGPPGSYRIEMHK